MLRNLPQLIDGLVDDLEHPDASVEHESGWSLSLFWSGRVVLENVEDECIQPAHCDLSRDLMLVAAVAVAVGEPDAIGTFGWLPGYG